MPRRAAVMVCLVSSRGGHLDELLALSAAYEHRPHVFALPPGPQAAALADEGRRVIALPDPGRAPRALAANARAAGRAVAQLRPQLVVTAGAGAAVPFCVLARARGAQLVGFETVARVRRASASGRILYRLAEPFLVQWPAVRARDFPRAELCRPLLLDEPRPARPVPGRGTFVAVGTHRQPFRRLLRLVQAAVESGVLPGPVTVQQGAAEGAGGMFAPDDVRRAVASHELLICHAGAGLIRLALSLGRRPIVLPRLREHGEHVDDHQRELAHELSRLGLAVSLERHGLAEAVTLARAPWSDPPAVPGIPLVDRLREIVDAAA